MRAYRLAYDNVGYSGLSSQHPDNLPVLANEDITAITRSAGLQLPWRLPGTSGGSNDSVQRHHSQHLQPAGPRIFSCRVDQWNVAVQQQSGAITTFGSYTSQPRRTAFPGEMHGYDSTLRFCRLPCGNCVGDIAPAVRTTTNSSQPTTARRRFVAVRA